MRLFVTGATGTLGRPTVRLLIEDGHDVVALARSDQNEAHLRTMGATPARADLFDRTSLESAMRGCDAVLHLATKIPPIAEVRKQEAWRENDLIRAEGTKVLVSAALRSEVPTLVYPSICFLYADHGDRWIDEKGTVHAPPLLYSAVLAEAEIERFTSEEGRGITLRMGAFWGPDAPNTDEALAMARKGFAPLIGPKDAYLSRIDVQDAARAVATALQKAPAGIYNVVEDEPRTRGELLEEIKRDVGRRLLFRIPLWMVRLISGRSSLALARSQRVSNRLFKETTDWQPNGSVPGARHPGLDPGSREY